MIDSVSKGQGNSRYLKSNIPASTTLQQLISMLNNGTFPVDFNGINEAGWLQIGTALNKANLFSDQTAAKYPDGTETVDGALSKIPNMVANISSKVVVTRIDTSRTWIAPKAIDQKFLVLAVGGGGGGGNNGGGGGGGGVSVKELTISENTSISVVCGAGGTGGTSTANGGTGGMTRFGSLLSASVAPAVKAGTSVAPMAVSVVQAVAAVVVVKAVTPEPTAAEAAADAVRPPVATVVLTAEAAVAAIQTLPMGWMAVRAVRMAVQVAVAIERVLRVQMERHLLMVFCAC